MNVVIAAAGLGSRMGYLVDPDTCKADVKIANKSLVDYTIDYWLRFNAEKIVVVYREDKSGRNMKDRLEKKYGDLVHLTGQSNGDSGIAVYLGMLQTESIVDCFVCWSDQIFLFDPTDFEKKGNDQVVIFGRHAHDPKHKFGRIMVEEGGNKILSYGKQYGENDQTVLVGVGMYYFATINPYIESYKYDFGINASFDNILDRLIILGKVKCCQQTVSSVVSIGTKEDYDKYAKIIESVVHTNYVDRRRK